MDRVSTDDLRDLLLSYSPLCLLLTDVPARAHLLSQLSGKDELSHMNILLVGEAGAGKSSLVSTWYRALHPEDENREPIAAVGRPFLFQTFSTTKKYQPFGVNAKDRASAIGIPRAVSALSDSSQVPNGQASKVSENHLHLHHDNGDSGSHASSGSGEEHMEECGECENAADPVISATILAYDSKGIVSMSSNINGDENEREYLTHMQHVMYGLVRPNREILSCPYTSYTLWDTFRFLFTLNRAQILDPSCRSPDQPPGISAVPHGVVIVLPANATTISPALARLVKTVREMGYHPVFAITKIDCHAGATNDTFASVGLVEDKKAQVMRDLQAEFADVLPVQNYVDFLQSDKTCDRLALKVLYRALERADEYVLGRLNEKKRRFPSCWIQ
eukprot:ANDGO_06159.mRNA.1 hypothetical protein